MKYECYIARPDPVGSLECLNPMNWVGKGPLANAKNNKHTRKTIEGLKNHRDKHLDKIKNDPNSRDVPGWLKEIKAAEERINRLLKRLPGGD